MVEVQQRDDKVHLVNMGVLSDIRAESTADVQAKIEPRALAAGFAEPDILVWIGLGHPSSWAEELVGSQLIHSDGGVAYGGVFPRGCRYQSRPVGVDELRVVRVQEVGEREIEELVRVETREVVYGRSGADDLEVDCCEKLEQVRPVSRRGRRVLRVTCHGGRWG